MEQVGGAITNSTAFQDIIKELSKFISSLAESGKIELWANNISMAMGGLAKAAGIALTPLKAIADIVDSVSAFAGGFAGASGQGFVGRIDAGTQQAKYAWSGKRDADEIAAIKAKAAEEKKAADAKEAAAKKAAEATLAAQDAEEAAAKRRKAVAEQEKKDAERRVELAKDALRIEKEIAGEKDAIAEREAEMGKRDLAERWEKELDAAEKLADRSKEWLDKRKGMGAVGSAQFREALQAEAKRTRRGGKINAKRKALGMSELDAAALEGMGDQELAMQEEALRIQRRLGLVGGKADGKMRLGDVGQDPEKLAELAGKQGRRLTKRQQEVLARNAAKIEELRNKGAAAIAAANIKALEDQADADWKRDMILANQTSATNLTDLKAILGVVEQNLDTLLRSSR